VNYGVYLSIALLIVANAFFVAAEFALVSSRRSIIELRALNGSKTARVTLKAMERVSIMLATAQLGVTLCSLALGAIGEPLIVRLLEHPFLVLHVPGLLLHPLAIVLSLGVMTYLHVVFGEMIPKNVALALPERAALLLTPPLYLIMQILYPVVQLLNLLANGVTRLCGVKPKSEVNSSFTQDEVAGFVDESHREGLLSQDEQQLLKGSLGFDKKTAVSILLETDTLIFASPQVTPREIEQLAAETGFSRFPIRNNRKKMIGYVHLKDMLGLDSDEMDIPIARKDFRPLPVIRNNRRLREVLVIMQRSGSHLAEVTDRTGTSLGLIALEDALEELVGEIRDDAQGIE
jgi:CBS domain containing-hemolysin-like protein